jgi:hypothetical protein
MKSLYESILDDEDVLIGDVKKTIDNIFTYIATHYKEYESKYIKFLSYIEDNYIEDIYNAFPSIKKTGYKLNMSSPRGIHNNKIVIILEIDVPSYKEYQKGFMYIMFDIIENRLSVSFSRQWDYGVKIKNRMDDKEYQKDIENFAKHNDLDKKNFYSFYKKYN